MKAISWLCIILIAFCFGDNLIKLFITLSRAQSTANGFISQTLGDQRQRMQMGFRLISRHQQREEEIDGLVINGIKGDRCFKLHKHTDGTQGILFQLAVRDCDAVADTGTCLLYTSDAADEL